MFVCEENHFTDDSWREIRKPHQLSYTWIKIPSNLIIFIYNKNDSIRNILKDMVSPDWSSFFTSEYVKRKRCFQEKKNRPVFRVLFTISSRSIISAYVVNSLNSSARLATPIGRDPISHTRPPESYRRNYSYSIYGLHFYDILHM